MNEAFRLFRHERTLFVDGKTMREPCPGSRQHPARMVSAGIGFCPVCKGYPGARRIKQPESK